MKAPERTTIALSDQTPRPRAASSAFDCAAAEAAQQVGIGAAAAARPAAPPTARTPAIRHESRQEQRMRAKRRRLKPVLGVGICSLALLAAGGAPAVTGCMVAQQERLLFAAAYYPPPTSPGPRDSQVEQVWITAGDGSRVEAWYQTGAGASARHPGPAYIYFHGNGDTIDKMWRVASQTVPRGFSTLVIEYRGYGRSTGEPSEQALIADSLEFYDWLVARPEVDRSRIVLHGTSLGGAVAIAVAGERPAAALVLDCTFTSMIDLAASWWIRRDDVRHTFRSDERIRTLEIPTAIFHGRYDLVIPIEHGRKLAAMARHAEFTELNCAHHNFHNDWSNVEAFLRRSRILRDD
jgi:hypothetical protein